MSSPISDCSSDFDAAETFAASLMGQIDGESVKNMVAVQRDMLSRFEKTNEMLINFNILSANRFAVTSAQFRRNTQLMYDMKKDLDAIFKRIRIIKQKLGKSYPEAFKVSDTAAPLVEDDEEDIVEVSGAEGSSKSAEGSSKSAESSLKNAESSSKRAEGSAKRTVNKMKQKVEIEGNKPRNAIKENVASEGSRKGPEVGNIGIN